VICWLPEQMPTTSFLAPLFTGYNVNTKNYMLGITRGDEVHLASEVAAPDQVGATEGLKTNM
jgi:hypothetical protein